MPLLRAEVRNEYALGAPELYREANKDEPKEILQGVAVAGLVGVLRQLGDLAEFAAEVFHGLQEEVTITTARSHKLMARVRRVESALSPLEKALLAQRSHLHFAYTSGSNWHTRIRCEQNHFIYSDVPQFITESYEDCRHPPCLHMLDRFDAGGPGSCLKRYSDPTFFKRASVTSGEASIDKSSKEKKARKAKKRRSRPRNEEMSRDASFSYNNHRTPFTQQSIGGGHISPTQTASTYDTMIRSDLGEQSNLDLRNGSGYIEGDFRPSYSVEPESRDSISSAVKRHENDFLDYSFLEEKVTDVYDTIEVGTQEQPGCSSSSIAWEEKRKSFEPTLQELNIDGVVQEYNHNRQLESFSLNLDMETLGDKCPDFEIVDQMIDQSCNEADGEAEEESGNVHLDDIESETDNFMDALNTIESESETDLDSTRKQVAEHQSKMKEKREDDDECELKRHDLECRSSCPESDVMAGSPLINGNPTSHGDSIIPMPQKSSYATDFIDDASPEDDLNSVSLMNKDLESSQRSGGSATPIRPKRNDAHGNDNVDAESNNEVVPATVSSNYGDGRLAPISDETAKSLESQNLGSFEHNLECQSSSPESNAVASSPLANGSCGHTLIPTSQKSLHATVCVASEALREDDVNSIPEMNNSLQSSQRSEDALSSGHPKSSGSHENGIVGVGMYVESVSSTVSSNLRDGRPRPVTDGTRKSSESHGHVPEISNVTPVSIWTNGGLLGLRPSKPPDCSVQNALPQDPEYKKDVNNNSSIQHFILSDNSGKPDQLETSRSIEEDLEMDISSHEYHESGMNVRKASWKISPADLEINLGKFGDSLYQHNAKSTGSNVPAPGSSMPANSAHQENSTNSCRIFGLSNRLLTNGSNQKSLPGGSGNTYSAGSKNANDFELKNYRSVENDMFSGRSKELFGGKSPILSPSSSPPLEHMKISFQPINGFESSKLKLKFPDGKNMNGSGSDIYPSFQLVPEVSIPRYNVGSDSDADTFYRSSPSLSDDCQSNQSESNSEQWESSESPTSKDRDLYDALRRISLTESVSEDGKANQENIPANLGVQFPFIDNGVQKSESCRSFDLQSLSTINNSFRKERIDSNPKYLVEPQFLPSSALPPLPPFQWRGTTSMDDKSDAMPEGSYYALDLTRSASTISQPKPAPLSEDQNDTTYLQKSKQLSSQKSNGQRPTSQSKSTDENDFLHQIRTKSFSLRPTMTTRSIAPSGAPATVQVNAILEKANAIRQAVASDAEDDGTWSDA
ncbi:protein SCAR3-like isoform X1 [Salvia hispanica]|uniref:protein SCAR3-like isoform X1 n=1 Tax=Salvia hispanica TaxID=49212 RepID=UPI00200926A2|nr:protein SCAR3-like isoform X1 [Salvia hispanica]